MSSALEELEGWLVDREGLAVPPMPVALAGALRRCGPCAYSTRAERRAPEGFREHLAEAQEPGLADYVLIGHASHGMNDYGLAYHLAWRRLRVLLELDWGGLYADADTCRLRIRQVYTRLHALWPWVPAYVEAPGPTVVFAHSDFCGSFLIRGDTTERWAAEPDARRILEALGAEVGG